MFNEAERRVFGPYFNGRDLVYADPLSVHRRLVHALEGDPNRYLQESHSTEEHVQYAAREKLLVATREALELMPFDPATGQGALEQDVMAALTCYLDWMQKKSPSTDGSPTSSGPMVQDYSALSNYPISTSAASGTTSPDCGCSEPGK